MRRANIKGALVGVEAVTLEGLKAVYKDFNYSGDRLVEQLQIFRKHGLHVLGSFIFGLPTDKPSTFDATVEVAIKADVTFAQFVMMTPFPRHDRLRPLGERTGSRADSRRGNASDSFTGSFPRQSGRRCSPPHASMSSDEIKARTQLVWDRFYNLSNVWWRSACTPTLRARFAFVMLSKLYRQMYAGTGISTDRARRKKAKISARLACTSNKKDLPGEADA